MSQMVFDQSVQCLINAKSSFLANANTIKEFSVYAWDPKASERGEDAPIKQNDHAMDAIRYFIYTILKGSGLNTDLEGGI